MFGYVKAQKSELKVWEYETYKAVYCSLCRQLGKVYGPFARLTLNYDFTFLCLLSLSLKNGCNQFQKKRCAFNPLKKCQYCTGAEEDLNLASATAMVMLYYKLLDNISDSSGIKKFGFILLKPFFKSKHKKAKKLFPHIDSIVEEYISKQTLLENENCTNIDEIAEPTSAALGKIFELCSKDQLEKRVLYQLGYCVGKWIYVVDCANDLGKDIKHGEYNPIKADMPENADPREYAKQRLLPVLNTCIYNATLSFELLNIKKYKGILENILYLGLKSSQSAVFEKEKK